MANLRVTINESIYLNNQEYGGIIEKTYSSINEVLKRIVNCPAVGDTILANFHSSVSDGTLAGLDVQDVRYVRVTNLSSSVDITLGLFIDEGEDDSGKDDCTSIKLKAGESFILGTIEDGIATKSDFSANNATMLTNLVDLHSIVVSNSTACDVEIMIASV